MRKSRHLLVIVLSLLWLSATATAYGAESPWMDPTAFRKNREAFQKKVDDQKQEMLYEKKKIRSHLFNEDRGRFNFRIDASEAERLNRYLKEFFNITDPALAKRMAEEMQKGAVISGMEHNRDKQIGVLRQAMFLPKLPYWERLQDIDGIEKSFAAYNASVALGEKEGGRLVYVMLQVEAKVFGVTQTASLPALFERDYENRRLSFWLPTQEEIIAAVNNLPPLNTNRTKLEEKFIDYCRRHPQFAEKKNGVYRTSDERLINTLKIIALEKDQRCPIKEIMGRWIIYEDFGDFNLATYKFYTRINLAAIIPDIPLITNILEKAAQKIADLGSARFAPLSLKGYRDMVIADGQKK